MLDISTTHCFQDRIAPVHSLRIACDDSKGIQQTSQGQTPGAQAAYQVSEPLKSEIKVALSQVVARKPRRQHNV